MRNYLPRSLKAAKGIGKFALFWLSAFVLANTPLEAKNATTSQEQPISVLQQSASTATALARAARDLPDSERLRTTQAALSIILLAKFDRILPNLPPTTINQLADIFLAENPDPAEQSATAAKLPPADTIAFDGSRLIGGNFRNIDAIIGLGGRPIALDRELPAWLVPLEPSRAQALDSTRGAGFSSQKFAELQSLFNRIHAADVGEHLVADGIFLRPYAGRMDDLYHHLVQQGGRNGQLDYFALLDSLPPRQYSPIAGTAARKSVPPLRVNLSNILSGGSLQAIQNFKNENPRANVQNPFKGFAVRTLPYLADQLRKTAPGSDLKLSGDLMQRAISDPRRFSPGKVPPLFLDPSRFLGQWEDPRFIQASKKKKASNAALFAEIQKVDFDTPLPELSFEPAGNALLSKAPAGSAPDNTNDLLNDLGLPPQAESTTKYEPPETPEPVLPPARITEPEAPAPTTLLTKPAPPLLDSEPLETPPVYDLAQAPTPAPPKPEAAAPPAPSPVVTEQPAQPPTAPTLASATPTPQPLKPSAIAVIPTQKATPPQPMQQETPAPAPAPQKEPQVARAIPVNPPEESRASSTSSCQVAVLAPTATEAIDYLKKIAASDISLSNNLAAARRADCVIRWLGDAVKPFEPLLTQSPESTEAKTLEPLLVQARDEVVALLKDREALQSSLMQELKSRQSARQALEKEIQTTRRDELAHRTGTGA
jgi:hypothetical protein